MKKEQKTELINSLAEQLGQYAHYYLTDISGLNAEKTSKLRKLCFQKDIKLIVVKNTFFNKALTNAGKENEDIQTLLEGPSAVMLSNIANAPAKLIAQFKKEAASDKPLVKAAFVDDCTYIGNDQLDTLKNLKSKEELVADVIALLQSPAKNVISALKSAPNTIAGLVKTLEQRA